MTGRRPRRKPLVHRDPRFSRTSLIARWISGSSYADSSPNGLPKRLGRAFPEQLVIRTGEPTQIPKTQSERDLGDGRLVWAARAKSAPGLMQTMAAKVFCRRDSVALLKGGSESPLRHAALPSQVQHGQRLVEIPHRELYGGLGFAMPTDEVTTWGMLTPREEVVGRLQQFIFKRGLCSWRIQELRVGFGGRKKTADQGRETSSHVRCCFEPMCFDGGRELQLLP